MRSVHPGRGAAGEPFFSAERHATRERSVADAVTLGVTIGAWLLLALVAVPLSGFERAVVAFVDAVPGWLDFLWRLGVVVLLSWVMTVLVVAALRRRADVLWDVGWAMVVALGLGLCAVRVINGSWPDLSEVLTGGDSGTIPLATLAMGATATEAAAAHLTRPYRRFGRWAVGVGAASAVLLEGTTPVGALLSVLLGGAASALVHVVVGTSTGRATSTEVTRSLALLGVEATDLSEARHPGGGVVLMEGSGPDGGSLRVKVYGRDARDAQFLARIWRTLWYRGVGPQAGSRVQLVEHEAFLALFAASRGVSVPSVLVAGLDDRRDALLAVVDPSTPLGDCDRDDVAAALPAIWGAMEDLHELGIAHRDVSPDTFGLADGAVMVRDLGSATLTREEDDVQKDRAEVLVTTAVAVGVEPAVAAAEEHLGREGVEQMLPYLQVAALSGPLRRELKAAAFDMDALSAAMAEAATLEVPEQAKLQRVSPQALLTTGLLALVAFALVTSLADIDLAELWDTLVDASPGWAAAALVVAQAPLLSQAVATRGATPRPMPLGPLTLLQSGIAFVALAVPSTAGRLALDIRFFQRQGIPAASAVSISAIDGFCGFLVQIALLILTLGLGLGDVELTFQRSAGGGSGDLLVVLGVIAALLVVLVVAALALPGVRRRLTDRLVPVVAEVRETMRSLRSVTKLLQLFGGNLANQLLYGAALGLCLEAFGGHLDLATLVVVYVAAALFGGLMPVPGGIGVVVAALTAGLVAAGIGSTTATAAAILFRLLTFYLPPLWGWIALRWLRRHDYL